MLLKKYSAKIERLISSIEDDDFVRAADCVGRLRETGGKVILIGNGGSAAICSHLAVDFTKSAGIRAISFSDPSLQTCFSNDYGYESAYAEMVDAYGDAGDVLIAISSSGSSANIVNATQKASALGISLITLSGFGDGNPLRKLGGVNFYLASSDYNLVENGHEQILLALCDYLRLGEVSFRSWVDG